MVKYLLPFMLLTLLLIPARAQTGIEDVQTAPYILADGWTAEEVCIPLEASPPPEDWTFDGTILYWGDHGIHGYNADWETTRVLNFLDPVPGATSPAGGSYSPDMMWYALPQGDAYCSVTCTNYTGIVDYISVYDISGNNPRDRITFEWQNAYYATAGAGGSPPAPRPIWIDNSTFLYMYGDGTVDETETRIVEPFGEEIFIQAFEREVNLQTTSFNLHTSPDITRNITFQREDDNSWTFALIDLVNDEVIHSDEDSDLSLIDDDPMTTNTSWSSDSQWFLMRRSDDQIRRLILFDRDGHEEIVLITLPNPERDPHFYYFETFHVEWSQDSRYVYIAWNESQKDVGSVRATIERHGVFDLEERRFTDFCTLDTSAGMHWAGVFWSPDNQYLGVEMWDWVNNSGWLNILDWQTGTSYEVLSFERSLRAIGWREE